jgi:hypothetical protein
MTGFYQITQALKNQLDADAFVSVDFVKRLTDLSFM